MIDKVYEGLIVKKENFGQWTEEIIKEGLREAYDEGYNKAAYGTYTPTKGELE